MRGRVSAVNSDVCGFFKRIGAFEWAYGKLMGTVTAVVFGEV
jgi:hypothetical protein